MESNQSLNQDNEDQHRQNKLKIGLEPFFQLDACAGIGFFKVVLCTPAPFGHAEQQVNQRANGKQQVADK